MKTKSEIVANWLPRYTGTPLKDFGKHILLVNFNNYVRLFAEWHGVPIRGEDRPMPNATAASDHKVTNDFLELHLRIGIDSLKELINHGLTVKHLRFE